MYLIYGKRGNGRFKAMDMNEGVQVANLIYATMFYETEDRMKTIVDKLSEANEDWTFEYRRHD